MNVEWIQTIHPGCQVKLHIFTERTYLGLVPGIGGTHIHPDTKFAPA